MENKFFSAAAGPRRGHPLEHRRPLHQSRRISRPLNFVWPSSARRNSRLRSSTRGEGFGINKISAITSILHAALLILFVLATKLTTAANAIFLQYTAPQSTS